MSKPEDSRDIGRTKKNIVLFMLSSVAFGVALSFLSWSASYLIPAWLSPEYVLGASLLSLLALGYLAFRLILPPLIIRDAVDCYLIQNMKKGEVLSPITVNYDFWFLAAHAFHELVKTKPEYKDVLTQPLDLRGDILKHFMIYSILAWLSKLPMFTAFAAYRTTVSRPPRIYQEPKEKMKDIHQAYYTANLSNVFLNIPALKSGLVPHITLPRSMDLRVNQDKVILRNRYVEIEVGYQIYRWSRGFDARLQNMLAIGEEERNSFGSVSAVITFEGTLSRLSALLLKADVYWNFARDTLESLRCEYSYSVLMNDMKEWLTWESLAKGRAERLP